MAKRSIGPDTVGVSAPGFRHREVARLLEVPDDLLGGPLGDPNDRGDIPNSQIGVARDRDQDQCVVG
jgi:hypothetical protein